MSLLNLLFFHITTAVPYRIPSEDELNKAYMKTKTMRSILSYIEANYQEKLPLSDVARHEHLSVTYLLHFFTENFGLNFQEYLSNLRYLNNVFKKNYGYPQTIPS